MLRHSAMRLVLSTSRCSQAPLAAATTTAASSAVMSAASRGALRVPLPPPTAAFAVRCRCFIGVNPSLRQEVPGQPRGADSQPASYAGGADAGAAMHAPPSLISTVEWSPELANTITLIGNLGADPTVVTLPSGSLACELRLAHKLPPLRGSATGERPTEWHKVSTYGELAQEAGRVLRKGQQIAIHGKLRVDEWTDRVTQQPRKMHKIIADQIALVAGPATAAAPAAGGYVPGPSQPPPQQPWGEDGQPPRTESWEADDQTVGAFGSAPPPPPPQYPPAQTGSASKDLQWGAYFDNPGEFYDNRVSKTNPKGPDFVSKDRATALWLNGAPQWVLTRLQETSEPQEGREPPVTNLF